MLYVLCHIVIIITVAIEVGFEQIDESFREGRETDSLFLQKAETPEDVNIRILLFTVSQFEDFRSTTGRGFSQEVLDLIDNIEFPATGICTTET